jgi:hypothetical protein
VRAELFIHGIEKAVARAKSNRTVQQLQKGQPERHWLTFTTATVIVMRPALKDGKRYQLS